MGFSVSRTVWLNNGYGVEFVITDSYSINFHIITEQDKTLVDNTKVCVGTDSCIRAGEEESLQDFAFRAHKQGLAFAESMIVEHKESLDLFAALGKVLEQVENRTK